MIKLGLLEDIMIESAAATKSLRGTCDEMIREAESLEALMKGVQLCVCDSCRGRKAEACSVDVVATFKAVIHERLLRVRGLCLECYRDRGTFIEEQCTHAKTS